MSVPSPQPRSWPGKRWWIIATFVFVVQIGLIYHLGERQNPAPRTPRPGPSLNLAGPASQELLALINPTLFALPQLEGFSGAAWMRGAQPEFKPMDWSEPPRWLALPASELAGTFRTSLDARISTNIAGPVEPPPALTLPSRLEFPGKPAFSFLEVEGDLNSRQLLTTMQLESRPFQEKLTNSVVQAAIDERGTPVSVALLVSSNDPQADKLSLEQTRAAQFAPLPNATPHRVTPPDQLRWATLKFHWHSSPMTAANP